MDIKISVILPVYNVEKYLRASLLSVVSQTLSDIEIILVDDGSTDGSGSLCDELKQTDSRIKVIHQKNSGLSGARNTGIDAASGKYIGFVDPDDTVCPDMLEKLYIAAETLECETVACGYRVLPSGEPVSPAFPCGIAIKTSELFNIMPRTHTMQAFCFSWRFLFERSLIKENNIKFAEGLRFCEDTPFNLACTLHSKKFCSLDEPLYNYFIHDESVMRKKYKPDFELHLDRQYSIKSELIREFGLSKNKAFMNDMYYYNLNHLMNILFENLYQGDRTTLRKKLRNVIKLRFIRESFKHYPITVFIKEPFYYLRMLAAKYRIICILKYLTDKAFAEHS